ncbi:sigma-70 family RNA polymerase sigma factor [Sulfuriroseicoccus oceanibius]|uniref:Sigma-70 family RNA polymerase sigma factor n=1 Tax=Sulfuriroseicoccus oceanibius TaxID=2707525 RepID=A0A6B3LCU5_9BACT|nr:sigma-70 family RNA polymerase sigma factor [Sulfuriroseicoccus oceanibius]QQL45864.1 sigma-70 family RNA polymerase sigma factor [Sulfuriroseicoccus oceanibius]
MPPEEEKDQEFVQLLTSHQTPLRAFVISLVPGSPDVEDILQDTNVVLWEKRESFELGTNFRAWAFVIARNVTMAVLRKNKRNAAPMLDEQVIHAVSESWHQREQVNDPLKRHALDLCLAALRPADREIVQARYQTGTSLTKHAVAKGRSAESLRTALYRIRAKLRKCVDQRVKMAGGDA